MSDALPFVVSVKRLKEFEQAIRKIKSRAEPEPEQPVYEDIELPPMCSRCITCGVIFEGPVERRWCSISCAKKWKRK